MIKTFGRQRVWVKRDGTQRPITEAWFSFPVSPIEVDFEKAKPDDPFECVYAQFWMRAYGSTEACIEFETAYVELRDTKGKWWMVRFILSVPAQENEKQFDAGEQLAPHTVMFNKPSKSRTLAAKELAHVKWELESNKLKKSKSNSTTHSLTSHKKAHKPKQKAHMVGIASIPTAEGKKVEQVTALAIRRKSGKGMIHFQAKDA